MSTSMSWSIRRELWENRSIYLGPLVVAAVVLLASLLSTITLPRKVRALEADPTKQEQVVRHFTMAPAPIMLTTFLVGFLYSLEALYSERRDRSILFWKSLPVSDITTVFSKVSIPLVVLPLIGLALSIVTVTVLMLFGTMVLVGNGLSPARLWSGYRVIQEPIIMFYGLAAFSLWFAPIYGWFLLISAWARRSPLLWATLPPLAIVAVERLLFNTTHFAMLLGYRLIGAMKEAFTRSDGNITRLSELAPMKFLASAGLWSGLVFAAACLAAAVRLRRNREPI